MTIEKVHEQRIKERRKMEHNINDTDDIVEKMRLLVADGTIWLTQKEIAELFQTDETKYRHAYQVHPEAW